MKIFNIFFIASLITNSLFSQAQEINQYPYIEDFEGSNWNTEGWDINNGDQDFVQSSNGYQSSQCLQVTNLDGYGDDVILKSPWFRLDNIDSALFSIKFLYSVGNNNYTSPLTITININQGQDILAFDYDLNRQEDDYWQGFTLQLAEFIPKPYEVTIFEFELKATRETTNIGQLKVDRVELRDVVYRQGYTPPDTSEHTIQYGWQKIDTLGLTLPNGKLALNSSQLDPNYQFWVNGSMKAGEILIQVDSVPDYVFEPDYALWSLEDIEQYIQVNKHLPGIPSQYEIKQQGGANMGEFNMKLLQKIEELTLHIIDLEKRIEAQEKRNN